MPSSPQKRKTGLRLIAVLLLGGWLVVLLRLSPHPSLLDKAAKTSFPGEMPYQWLPNQELLVCEKQGAQPVQLARWDVPTGHKIPLSELSQRFPQRPGTFAASRVSPDGKWLLYGNDGQIYATTLDGSQHLHWHDTGNEYGQSERIPFSWLADSRRFARLPYYDADFNSNAINPPIATLRDINTPQSVQQQIFPPTPEFDAYAYYALPRMTNSGLIYSYASAYEENPTRTLLTVPLAPNAAKSKTVVHAPPGMTFLARPSAWGNTVLMSPGGDYVVWLLHSSTYTPPLRAWLHRILPRFKAKSYQWLSLYISRPDGSDMHEIGGVEMEMTLSLIMSGHTQGFFRDDQEIEDLRWLPDGKHLSFVHNKALYTVPTE